MEVDYIFAIFVIVLIVVLCLKKDEDNDKKD